VLQVERFYKNIVEESLFGKDPDVAEDMTDPKTSTEAISRRRQRNEICVSLKRSSIIHHVYIAKNFVKVLLIIVYLPENVGYALTADEEGSACSIPIMAFPGVVPGPGEVHFQVGGLENGLRSSHSQRFICAFKCELTLGLSSPFHNAVKAIASFGTAPTMYQDHSLTFSVAARSCRSS